VDDPESSSDSVDAILRLRDAVRDCLMALRVPPIGGLVTPAEGAAPVVLLVPCVADRGRSCPEVRRDRAAELGRIGGLK
jgi:hypothetical protein